MRPPYRTEHPSFQQQYPLYTYYNCAVHAAGQSGTLLFILVLCLVRCWGEVLMLCVAQVRLSVTKMRVYHPYLTVPRGFQPLDHITRKIRHLICRRFSKLIFSRQWGKSAKTHSDASIIYQVTRKDLDRE